MHGKVRYILAGLSIFIILYTSISIIKLNRKSPSLISPEPYKVRGDPQSPVFILVFSDFACPFCKRFKNVLDRLLGAYPSELRVVFKHYPLNIHPPAFPAAEAAECAADQGMFWPYHDLLFENVDEWFTSKDLEGDFVRYAGKLGLDEKRFKDCFELGSKKRVVNSNLSEGKKFFVGGTPTCFLNGKKIMAKFSFEYLNEKIKAELPKGERR